MVTISASISLPHTFQIYSIIQKNVSKSKRSAQEDIFCADLVGDSNATSYVAKMSFDAKIIVKIIVMSIIQSVFF